MMQFKYYKKYFGFISLFILKTMIIFATGFSEFEIEQINNFHQLRMEMKAYDNTESALKKLDESSEKIANNEIQENLKEEAKFYFDVCIDWERYNWLYEMDRKKNELKNMMLDIYNRAETFLKNHEKEKLNPWIYGCVGDIISSTLQYLSLGEAMKQGLAIKKLYEQSLELDENISWVLMNFGQWYFHAPTFAGGGKKKALVFFEKAINVCKTESESFYANMVLSQCLFELNRKDECDAALSIMDKLTPHSTFVAFLKKLNADGFSYYYYVVNRDKFE